MARALALTFGLVLALPLGAVLPVGALPPAALAGSYLDAWARWWDRGSTDLAFDAAWTPAGAALLAGSSYADGAWEAALLRYDAHGALQWARAERVTHGLDRFAAVVALPDDGAVAVGMAGNHDDLFALRVDAAGQEVWRLREPLVRHLKVNDAALLPDGSVAVVGEVLIDPVRGGYQDHLLAITPDGTLAWHRALGSGSIRGLAVLPDRIVAAGSTGFNVHAWAFGFDGALLAEHAIPSSTTVGAVVAFQGGALLAGSRHSLLLGPDLREAWRLDVGAAHAGASGDRAVLVGRAIVGVDGAGEVCAASPRPLAMEAYGSATHLTGWTTALPGSEWLLAADLDARGRVLLGGARWGGDAPLQGLPGWSVGYDAYALALEEVAHGC